MAAKKQPVTAVFNRILDIPWIFDAQQAICNNYSAVKGIFEEELAGEGLKVLDIGCSTGASIAKIFDLERLDYTGLDMVPEYVEIAKGRKLNGKFFAMDATKMDFPDASFDRALFLGVWHHMPDEVVTKALQELARVLKPGGKILVAEPMFTPGRPLSTFFLRHDRGHFIRDREAYKALTRGWKIERERDFDFSLHRFMSLVLVKEG